MHVLVIDDIPVLAVIDDDFEGMREFDLAIMGYYWCGLDMTKLGVFTVEEKTCGS